MVRLGVLVCCALCVSCVRVAGYVDRRSTICVQLSRIDDFMVWFKKLNFLTLLHPPTLKIWFERFVFTDEAMMSYLRVQVTTGAIHFIYMSAAAYRYKGAHHISIEEHPAVVVHKPGRHGNAPMFTFICSRIFIYRNIVSPPESHEPE